MQVKKFVAVALLMGLAGCASLPTSGPTGGQVEKSARAPNGAPPIKLVQVETATDIITMGLDGSIDDAFKEATSDMATWLAEDYKLTPSEIAQVLGTAAEYHVSEVADRNAGVVLKISKARLATLTQ